MRELNYIESDLYVIIVDVEIEIGKIAVELENITYSDLHKAYKRLKDVKKEIQDIKHLSNPRVGHIYLQRETFNTHIYHLCYSENWFTLPEFFSTYRNFIKTA